MAPFFDNYGFFDIKYFVQNGLPFSEKKGIIKIIKSATTKFKKEKRMTQKEKNQPFGCGYTIGDLISSRAQLADRGIKGSVCRIFRDGSGNFEVISRGNRFQYNIKDVASGKIILLDGSGQLLKKRVAKKSGQNVSTGIVKEFSLVEGSNEGLEHLYGKKFKTLSAIAEELEKDQTALVVVQEGTQKLMISAGYHYITKTSNEFNSYTYTRRLMEY